MVPIRPVRMPDASSMDLTIYVVVVFPLVPVTPMIFISDAGLP